MGIGTETKKLRMQRGLKQQELADALGILRPVLSLYENEKLQTPHHLIPIIADFFDITIDELFGRE